MIQIILDSTMMCSMLAIGFLACSMATGIVVYSFLKQYQHDMSQIETLREEARKNKEGAHHYLLQRLSDLRRPLQGILGVRDIYAEEAKTSEMKDFLEVVDHCVKFVVNQLDRVQFYSEFETNKITASWKPNNIKDIINKAVEGAEATVFKKDAHIDLFVNGTVPTFVMADSLMLQVVLREILTNALKHIDCGPVSLKVAPSERTAGEIEFTVSDCGPGINETDIARALESGGKNGLGLPIVRQVIKKMHGRYTVSSQSSRGTVFTISLPLPRVEPKASDLVQEPIHTSSSRILVVDDEPMTRQLMRKLLERLGHSVTLAENGYEAVQLHLDHNFGIIFMDIEMPEMNGFDAAKSLIQLSKSSAPKIVALTSHGLTNDREACKEAGMIDFLAKPAGLHSLEQVLERLGAKPLVAIEKMIELSRMYALYGEDERLVKDVFRQAQKSLPKLQDALNAAVMAASQSDIQLLLAHLKENLSSIHCDDGVNRCEALGALASAPDTQEFMSAMEDLNKSLHKVMGEVSSLMNEKDLSAKLAG